MIEQIKVGEFLGVISRLKLILESQDNIIERLGGHLIWENSPYLSLAEFVDVPMVT